MSLIPAMFQFVRKLVGASEEKRVAFAPLATPMSNDDFLFMNTEIFKQDPSRYYAEALEFSQKANSVIKDPLIWEAESTDFVYDKWRTIMTRARLIDAREFTAAEQAAQEAARKVLFTAEQEPTAEFNAYKSHQEETNKAAAAMTAHQAVKPQEGSAEWPAWLEKSNSLQAQFSDKELQWKALGFKNEMEKALKAFDQPKDNMERDVFAAQWREGKSFLETIKAGSAASGSDIFPMSCTPNNLYEYKGTKWTQVTLNKTQIAQLTTDLKQEVKGVDLDNVFGTEPVELESVSFEICRVIFSRSWLNENLLVSRNWNFNEDKVAAGEMDNFEGILPAYPVEFILVKNVQPELVAASPVNEVIRTKLQTGKPVFMGPFIICNTPATAGQNRLKVQTFTGGQLKKITSAFETSMGGVAVTTTKHSRSRGVQMKKNKGRSTWGNGSTDNRGRREAAITGRVLTGPVVRDHRAPSPPGTPTRAGFIWVVDHWEREKAKPPELPKCPASLSTRMIARSMMRKLPC